MIPLFKPFVAGEIDKEIINTLHSRYLAEGKKVREFESSLSSYLNYKKICCVNSCTSGLTLAYDILNLKKGDELITTPVTCVATNIPLLHYKAKIIWADVNEFGLIDINSIKSKITERTKAIVGIDWCGIPFDLREFQKLNIPIIEDAAQAFGAEYDGKKIGMFSDFTVFSFQAIKTLTCGDGGLVCCKNENHLKSVKNLKWFGIDREGSMDNTKDWRGSRWNVPIKKAGFKFNMNDITATIGISNLKYVGSILDSHRLNAKFYHDSLSSFSGIKLHEFPYECNPSHWVFPMLVENRDRLAKKLKSKDIDCSMLHLNNGIYECFPNCELKGVKEYYENILCIPCGWWLKQKDLEYVINEIKGGW